MKIEVHADAEAVARAAASIIAIEARVAVAARGRFVMAVSGAPTLAPMLRALALEDVPWSALHVAQVDERIAPARDPERNICQLAGILLRHVPLRADHIVAMPVDLPNLAAASALYTRTLRQLAGTTPVFDLVHLGLGADGHTASLVPGDPVLDVTDVDVAVTEMYQGRRRMTLTYPILNRARSVLWVVTGGDMMDMLARLREGDPSIPAGRVRHAHALVLVDRVAASEPGPRC